MKKRIIAMVLAVVALVTALIVPINAATESTEENSLLTDEQNFWIKYPFFNILPLTWESIAGEHNGTTITVDENGAIHVKGKINAPGENPLKPGEMLINYYDIVLYEGNGIELPPTVTIAANDTSKKSYLYLFLEGSSRINVQEGETVTFNTNGKKLIKLILRLRYDPENPNPNDCIVHPTLNAGNVAYPYQPYSVKDQLLGEGYGKGYEDGIFSPSAEEYWVQIGYDYGHKDGYEAGWDLGNDYGYGHGYDAGSQDGYTNGYEMGHEQGYSEGFSIGTDYGEQQEVSKNIIGVVDSIAMAPSKAIGEMLSFEVFGFKIDTLVFRLITVMLVLAVIGLVIKFFLR